jgi:hypothetical protein
VRAQARRKEVRGKWGDGGDPHPLKVLWHGGFGTGARGGVGEGPGIAWVTVAGRQGPRADECEQHLCVERETVEAGWLLGGPPLQSQTAAI